MRVIVLGSGFVGLTHAAILAERGLTVVACDIDREKIAAFSSGRAEEIERYVNEPGLSACVREGLERGTLTFDVDPTRHLEGTSAVFLCLPTPAGPTGATNLSFYRAAVRKLIGALAPQPRDGRLLLVNKSTVPIGTARSVQQSLAAAGVHWVGVASNPEFLPQGYAVAASRKPSRIVVGAAAEEDFALLRELYAPLMARERTPWLETTLETAEAVKYVSNALLFTYVSFWNGVAARLGEEIETVRMSDLRAGVISDDRISDWGAAVGNGAGGSCFGKDLRSLAHQMEKRGLDTALLRDVLAINEVQKTYLLDRAEGELGFDFTGKSVALLGLSFKKNTNDLRDASAVAVIRALVGRGVREIRAYDPLVDGECAQSQLAFEQLVCCSSAAEALRGSEAAFVCNDSDEFRALAGLLRQEVAPPYVVIDGRCMVAEPEQLVAAGFSYLCVGDSARKPSGLAASGKECAA